MSGYTFLVIGGAVGAHLLEVLAYRPDRLKTEGIWLLAKVWDGSASAGGALGGFAATFFYYRSQGLRTGRYLDALTLGVAPGWGIARLGCAAAQDHPGIRSSSWLAMQFLDGPRLDLGLLDAVVLFVLSAVLWTGCSGSPPRSGSARRWPWSGSGCCATGSGPRRCQGPLRRRPR